MSSTPSPPTPAIRQPCTQSGTPVTGPSKGTFDLAFSDKVFVDASILLELIHQEVVRRDIVITPAQIQTSADSQKSQMGNDAQGLPLWNGFSASYQNLLATRAAEVDVLQNAIAPVRRRGRAEVLRRQQGQLASNCVSHILVASQAQATGHPQPAGRRGRFRRAGQEVLHRHWQRSQGRRPRLRAARRLRRRVRAAVAALSPGQLSGAVHTQFGYHLIKLTGRKTSLDDVRSQIVTALQSQGATKLSDFVQAQVGKATVSVNPAYRHL